MAKKKHRQSLPPQETRIAEVLTVGWMLTVMTTLACGLVSLLLWLAFRDREGAERLVLFSQFLHFSALAMGLFSLGLMAGVLRTRRTNPPKSILIFAVIVALAPLVAALL